MTGLQHRHQCVGGETLSLFAGWRAGQDLLTGRCESPNHLVRVTIVGVVADFIFEGDKRVIVPTIYDFDPGQHGLYLGEGAGGRRAAGAGRDRPHLARLRAFDRHQPALPGRGFREAIRRPTNSRARFSACSWASPSSSPAWACSGWRRSRPSGAPRRSASARVFGARSRDIVLMLLWQFSIPVLIANLIAWPVAYYYLRNWLEEYAYRISLSPLYFLGAGCGADDRLGHGVRACPACGAANPIHALRYE